MNGPDFLEVPFDGNGFHNPLFAVHGSTSHYSLETTSASDRGEQSIPYPVTRRLWGRGAGGQPGAWDDAQIDEGGSSARVI